MSVPETATESSEFSGPGYAAHAQLVKMLLPSSGCFAIYGIDGDLAWCSDGFERPDFRELVDALRQRDDGLGPNQGTVRQTSGGVSALAARLCDEQEEALGYVLIELGAAHGAGRSMATSLARPFLSCLASQLALERGQAAPLPPETKIAPIDPRLDFLLGLSDIDLNSPHAVQHLLRRCVDRLDCVSAAFCVPDQDLTEVAERTGAADEETRAQLDSTRKHLLAWAQLNNRPMVVNEIESAKAPYKILSCPVLGRKGASGGLIALFRAMDGANFELDDVRMIEFLSRQAMALLYERQDPLSGLMSRSAFERYLDERLAATPLPTDLLLYVDIDALKSVNETMGFSIGDEVIQRTAQLIRRSLMPQEQACRISGDRFALHLVERDQEAALALGLEIARQAEELGYTIDGERVPLRLSYGIAAPPAAGSGARHWIAAAERACQESRADEPPSQYNASSSA